MDDKSGAGKSSYLAESWKETWDWVGCSHLTVFFLCTAIGRFYLNMCLGDGAGRTTGPAIAASGRERARRSSGA